MNFTSRILRLYLEITVLINKHFFLQIAYELFSQSRKLNKRAGLGVGGGGGGGMVLRRVGGGDGKFFEKKISVGNAN